MSDCVVAVRAPSYVFPKSQRPHQHHYYIAPTTNERTKEEERQGRHNAVCYSPAQLLLFSSACVCCRSLSRSLSMACCYPRMRRWELSITDFLLRPPSFACIAGERRERWQRKTGRLPVKQFVQRDVCNSSEIGLLAPAQMNGERKPRKVGLPPSAPSKMSAFQVREKRGAEIFVSLNAIMISEAFPALSLCCRHPKPPLAAAVSSVKHRCARDCAMNSETPLLIQFF